MDLFRHIRAHYRILEEASCFISGGQSVLDIGCGTGLLAEHLPHSRLSYRGIDLSPDFIRIARERHAPRSGVVFEVADANGEDFGAGAWDVAAILDLLHLPGIDAPALLRKALGALKPGGRLIVSGPRSPEILLRREALLIDELRKDGALAGNEEKVSALCAENRRALGQPGYYCSAEGMQALLDHLGTARPLAARNDLADGHAFFVVAQK
jgi:SAM-dependent methyltransferase